MLKGIEKWVLILGILIFCFCMFIFEVFFEFFSLSFDVFVKIKIFFVIDVLLIWFFFIRVFFISDELEIVRLFKIVSY